MVAGKSPDWLPPEWTEQVKVKNGRKVKYYSNTETGQKFYSKNDVIRYIEMGSICRSTPQQKCKDNESCSKNKAMQLALKTNETPEWLPHGWIMELKTRNGGTRNGSQYKCYIDPLTGLKFYSKPKVCEYLRTVKHNSCTSQPKKMGLGSVSNPNMGELTGDKTSLELEGSQNMKTLEGTSCTPIEKQTGFSKQSVKKVVIQRFTPDGLPPGWIKEIKIEKKPNGIRKDPYYTDPVSGYVFRSQKDALRYLETGDFSRCAIKPKKRDELGFLNEDTSLPFADNMQKLGLQTTRRQLFAGREFPAAGTENSVTSRLETCAEGSQKRQCTSVSVDATITSTPTAVILEGKHSLDNAIEECAETKESKDPSSSLVPKTEGFERKQGEWVCAENGNVSTPSAEMGREEKLAENGLGKNSNIKVQIDSSKSKKKRALITPSRSSKRVAGLKPEMVVNSLLSERVLRAAARKSGEPSLGALDNVEHNSPQPFGTVSETETGHHAFTGTVVPSNVEMSNRSKKPMEDQAVPEDQPVEQETEKKDEENLESQLPCPFGDSWSDPCLEFAFKTLTGAIPIEDNLAIQGYFPQQVDLSHTQSDDCLEVPQFGLPNIFQSDVSFDFDVPGKPASAPQLPANPSFLPPENISLPSCSGNAPQQPSSEGNEEHQTKVNS